jgi:murein DD-endopeptidase MepM/ murein hydrolase activator NlpD
MAPYPLLLKWMLACAGSALAGLLVWALLAAASRLWPALLSRRAVWLAAHAVVAAAALLPFLPRAAQLGIAPPLTLSAGESSIARASTPADIAADADGEDGASPLSATLLLPPLWMLAYAAGLIYSLARLWRARRIWRCLLAAARPLPAQALLAHGAFSPGQLTEIARRRLRVMETNAAISPMLVGAFHPLLLLPRHLRDFSAEQQQMIVAHELRHWRRRDPLCLGLAAALRTLFWFNPALPWMRRKLEWALELACDQHVLAGRPQQERKQYAAALLMQWKAQAALFPAGGVAFGGIDGMTVAARIRQMQQATLPALSRAAVALVAVSMAGILAAGALLQPALAFNAEPLPAPAMPPAAMAIADAQTAWRYPLEKMRVTGFFGIHRDILATPHKGIDLGAAKGTPVHAAADGVVIAAGALAENDGRYGITVIIDHGGQQSLYAHLDSVAVKAGERVAAGATIGAVGETGLATGPHLHFEVRRDGRLLDPAAKLAGLDAHATKHALRVRRQQLTSGI